MCFALILWKAPMTDRLNRDRTSLTDFSPEPRKPSRIGQIECMARFAELLRPTMRTSAGIVHQWDSY